MKQTTTDELLDVLVSLRFASSYKAEFIRWFIRKRVECSAVECNQRTTETEEVTDS
jgi:hypothetical protein